MWNNANKCVIMCVPGNLEEVTEMVQALIPRLKHEYRKAVLKIFHPDAVADSSQITWDPVMRVATSPDDEAFLLDEESDDDEYNFAMIETNNTLQDELNQHIQGVSLYTNTLGNDSISTFLYPKNNQ